MKPTHKKKQRDDLSDLIELDPLPELQDEEDTMGIDGVLDPLPSDADDAPLEDDDHGVPADTSLPDTYDDDWTGDDASVAMEDEFVDMGVVYVDEDDDETSGAVETEASLEDDWFVDENSDTTGENDDREGPESADVFEIDTSRWAKLSSEQETDEVETEDIFETMKRLDISLDTDPSGAEDDKREQPETVDIFFLGPQNGEIQAVLFHDGAPVGVGDGLYLSGADQMLHAAPTTVLGDVAATSVTGKKGVLFVGTTTKGAFRIHNRYREITPINSWFTEGLDSDDSVPLNACSTAFSVTGQILDDDAFRLLGWTGEGQLYCSVDDGNTWSGPLLKGRSCETVKAAAHGDHVVVLASSRSEVAVLLQTRDLHAFELITLPPHLAYHLTPSNAVFDVAPGLMAAGVDLPAVPLFLSSDNGQTWQTIESIAGVTALAIDPDDANWLAVAVARRDGTGAVCVSENRGQTWKTVFTRDPRRDRRCRITHLVLCDSGAKSLIALTEAGAYWLALDQKELTH